VVLGEAAGQATSGKPRLNFTLPPPPASSRTTADDRPQLNIQRCGAGIDIDTDTASESQHTAGLTGRMKMQAQRRKLGGLSLSVSVVHPANR